MFTIRHIHLAGDENIFSVNAMRFSPGTESVGLQNQSGTPPTLWISDDDHTAEWPVTGGTVFVMNASGKTVARYDLGASPIPIIGDGLSDPRPHGTMRENAARLS